MAKHPIQELRRRLGMTQIEFGEAIGLANKTSVSLLERNERPCSAQVAIAIERLSGGKLDAAKLNADVAAIRKAAVQHADAA